LHPAAAGLGTKVFRKGKSRLTGSASTSRRQSSHEKEAADKAQNTLILQPDIAMRSTGFTEISVLLVLAPNPLVYRAALLGLRQWNQGVKRVGRISCCLGLYYE
jgi:hypothetical protein